MKNLDYDALCTEIAHLHLQGVKLTPQRLVGPLTPYVAPRVHHIVHEIKRAMRGSAFPRDALIARLACARNDQPIEIWEDPCLDNATAYYAPLRDRDILGMRRGLLPDQALNATCHELGHVAGGHIPLLQNNPQVPLAVEFKANLAFRKQYAYFFRDEQLHELFQQSDLASNLSTLIDYMYKELIAEQVGAALMDCVLTYGFLPNHLTSELFEW